MCKKEEHKKKSSTIEKKNSRTLCAKLLFSRILQVQEKSKGNSRKSRNSSKSGYPVCCVTFKNIGLRLLFRKKLAKTRVSSPRGSAIVFVKLKAPDHASITSRINDYFHNYIQKGNSLQLCLYRHHCESGTGNPVKN